WNGNRGDGSTPRTVVQLHPVPRAERRSIEVRLRRFKIASRWNIGHARNSAKWLPLLLISLSATVTHAQTCLTTSDMDEGTPAALVATATRFYDMAARADSASLRQNAIASLASDFSGIDAALKENQAN